MPGVDRVRADDHDDDDGAAASAKASHRVPLGWSALAPTRRTGLTAIILRT